LTNTRIATNDDIENICKGVNYIVAENDQNELVGFSSYGRNRIEGISINQELYTLYASKAYQRKGVGKLLLNTILDKISKESIVVSVFRENPYKQFYIKNGFVKVDEEQIEINQFKFICGVYIKSK